MKKFLLSLLALIAIAIGAKGQDMTATPLTIEAVEAGTIKIVNPNALTIEYNKNGEGWTTASSDPISITVAANDVVQFRGDNESYWASSMSGEAVTRFTATNPVYVYGNVMSLVHKDDFATNSTLTEEFALAYLFAAPTNDIYRFYDTNTTIRNHSTKNLVLPATSVPDTGYGYMFAGCQGLTRAPELPATTLAMGCYHQMFAECTGLTTAPALPATALSDMCYSNMFDGCSSLTTAPALPATTLAAGCYFGMFTNCSSLVNAPMLPATTLAEDCYHRMFEGCTSLQKAPTLPAPTLFGQVYGGMFDGCTSLNYVKCLATTIVDTSHGDDATTTAWLAGVAATGTFVKADEADWSVKTLTGAELNGIPEGWTVGNASDYDSPLTFEAVEAGTIKVANPLELTYEYKQNAGEWTASNSNPICISVTAGDVVQFRGDNSYTYSEAVYDGTRFTCTNDCYVYGNVMSLLSSTGFADATTMNVDYGLGYLFTADEFGSNTTIKNHPTKNIVLPATTLGNYTYLFMFFGCEGLTRAPELPATILGDYCYDDMFSGCTSLVTGPTILPATTLSEGCYTFMFNGCSSLKTAPTLPATTLANMCYDGIFMDCTSLETAPELPSTTLVGGCYSEMFMNCTSLKTAPELPAETLVEGCYSLMFNGCTNLNYVKCLATDISADYCTINWLDGVAATGTFKKATGMEDWTTGVDGIPTGWTVIDPNMFTYTVPASGIGTYSNDVAFTLPEGLTAYYCKTYDTANSTISVVKIDGAVPANTGVLLKGTPGETYILTTTTETPAEISDNALVAVVSATHVEPTSGLYTNFMMTNGCFVKIQAASAETKMPANRAYLQILTADIPTGSTSRTITLNWGDETTGIASMEDGRSKMKDVNDTWYTLDGRRMMSKPTQKGVYIYGGHKVVIK